MVKVPKNWERLLIELAALHGVTDFLARGRLTKAEAKVFYAILNRLGRPTAAAAATGLGRIPGTARFLVMRHPVVATAAVLYMGYQERDRIKAALEQGYEIVEAAGPARQEALMDVAPLPFTDFKVKPLPGVFPETFLGKKRRPSAFNKAVSAGMSAIKKSTSYGGKGKIKPAQKAFSVVVKLAAAKKKKKKAPKSGIRRRIWNAMKGLR